MSTTIVIKPKKSKRPKTATHQSLATGRYYKISIGVSSKGLALAVGKRGRWVTSGHTNVDLLNPRYFKML